MENWLNQIEVEILTRRLLKKGDSVLVAVSGGLDSMVLLHSIGSLAARHKWRPRIAHFNHQLRGRSSNGDENLVRRIAAEMKAPCDIGSADVRGFAKKSGLSIEMAARKLRHEFLARTARKHEIRTVALGHHADDQVELFLMRLLRGAGGEGLGGMKWQSPSPADSKITLIRPLLAHTKEELQRQAGESRIVFREDASNHSLDFHRNKVRHKLIPLLKEFQPALISALLRTVDIVGSEAEFVGREAHKWFRQPTNFEQLPTAVQRRVLLEQLTKLGISPEFTLVEHLRRKGGTTANISASLKITRSPSGLVHLVENPQVSFNEEGVTVHVGTPGKLKFERLNLSWVCQPKSGATFKAVPNTEYFDADKVGSIVTLRHWRPGDRFQPIGMKSPVKLQDLFTNLKIPREDRHRKAVAAADDGRIFWVEGVRISEEFKLLPSSKRRLRWSWKC